MAALETLGITLLASLAGVDMKTAGSTTLYIVPAGQSAIITKVVTRNNSASLAGGTSYSFTNFRQTVDLSGMTTTTGYRELLAADNTTYVISTTGTAIQITVITGATAAGTATIELFGYLV